MSQSWHSMLPENVLQALQTGSHGLGDEEAARRLAAHGPNKLLKNRGHGTLKLLLRQMASPLIYVLLAAGVFAAMMGKGTDALVIFSVVFINTVIGFLQEWGADRTIRGLMDMAPEYAVVKRNGVQKKLRAEELVPGDLVILQAGDKLSADLRLVQVKSFQCEEAALTGESVPVTKRTVPVDDQAGIGDRYCMAFAGTLVTHGTAEGIVVGTGMQTEIGKISALLQDTPTPDTPLTKSIAKLGGWITISIILVCLLLFAIATANINDRS